MRRRTLLIPLIPLLLSAACGPGGGGGGGPYGGQAGQPTRTEAAKAAVRLADSAELGKILTDAGGRTLYLFEKDAEGPSTCYDACADAWPPLLTTGDPQAAEGLDAALLGTVRRKDGKQQVTYGGHPLYYFVQDKNPGDTNGQDIDEFGAEWYAVAPNGDKAHEEKDGSDQPPAYTN